MLISIHALLAESDQIENTLCQVVDNFYPRSPCGERPLPRRLVSGIDNFYPRSPCGERLINTYHRIFGEGISIHALLAESDDY